MANAQANRPKPPNSITTADLRSSPESEQAQVYHSPTPATEGASAASAPAEPASAPAIQGAAANGAANPQRVAMGGQPAMDPQRAFTEAAKALMDRLERIEAAGVADRNAEVAANTVGASQPNGEANDIERRLEAIEGAINARVAKLEAAAARSEIEAATREGGDDPHSHAGRGAAIRAFVNLVRARTGGNHSAQAAAEAAYVEAVHGPDATSTMLVSDDTSGGFLAPPEMVTDMIMLLQEQNPVRAICRPFTVGSSSMTIPRQTAHAEAKWVGEIEDEPEQSLNPFGMREIPVREMYAMVPLSRRAIEDTQIDLEGYVREDLSMQFAIAEGKAFVGGDGLKKPKGFADDSDIPSYTTSTAGKLSADDLIGVYYAPLSAYAMNSTWVLKRSTTREIRRMKTSQGDYLWAPDLANTARAGTILGRPYVEADQMDAIGNGKVALVFGDFRRGYGVVDRTSISFLIDPYTAKSQRIVQISACMRVGGDVLQENALRRVVIKS